MRTIILTLCCFLLMHAHAFTQKTEYPKETLLSGKTFTIVLLEKGGGKNTKPQPDIISFKAGKMSSTFMGMEKKMPASVYEISVDSLQQDSATAFISESKNADGETLTWEAITKPDGSIEGTIKLSKKGKTKKEYTFSGALKTKNKK